MAIRQKTSICTSSAPQRYVQAPCSLRFLVLPQWRHQSNTVPKPDPLACFSTNAKGPNRRKKKRKKTLGPLSVTVTVSLASNPRKKMGGSATWRLAWRHCLAERRPRCGSSWQCCVFVCFFPRMLTVYSIRHQL